MNMRNALAHFSRIERRILEAPAVALLFDFDGTLSPIVPLPHRARLPALTRKALRSLHARWPVCIVTGRPLSVIVKKVAVPEFLYGASHGLEWKFGTKTHVQKVPLCLLKDFAKLRQGVRRLRQRYPRLIEEKKRFGVIVHYHLVPRGSVKRVEHDIRILLAAVRRNPSIRILWDKQTVDIVPKVEWTKGDIAAYMLNYLRTKTGKTHLPLYAGDTTTDEDAFQTLRNGITIRVGEKRGSAARYFLQSQTDVAALVRRLLRLQKASKALPLWQSIYPPYAHGIA